MKAGCSFIIVNEVSDAIIIENSFTVSQLYPLSLQPEYESLCQGLDCALRLGLTKIRIVGSSEIVFIHLTNGVPKYLQTSLRIVTTLVNQIKSLLQKFMVVEFEFITATSNSRAIDLAKSAFMKEQLVDA